MNYKGAISSETSIFEFNDAHRLFPLQTDGESVWDYVHILYTTNEEC